MRTKITVSVLAAAIAMTGCANMTDTQKKTTTGAGVGAAAGAVLGAVTGPGGWARALGGAALGGLIGGGGTYLWSKHMEKQKDDMTASTQNTGVTVTKTEDNFMQVNIPSDISFTTGSSQLNSDFRHVLDKVAANLKAYPNTHIIVAGHTDSTGSDAINNQLSRDRATHVRNYLVSQGVQSSRIRIEGLGSQYPTADNSTAEGRAENRRVEIYVGEKTAS
ncbi:OmpA family protein [Oxalobacter vibrioformis]|uniref:OmpA family protein n=1 Tax=Oxalobacter vibrioformis TaxID=933080 RepID=A0A9E9LVW3_9BURK|nr:OmpA family protein [Oxalobacter vibrioformis]WAW09799.1 OmpA family protein [Oxalobacter vibrioformis]